jgi:hypothetical protein
MQDESLFNRWIASYPEPVRRGFHRDGIVDESFYWRQPKRIVFVLLEPNSKGGNFDRFYGMDLREVLRIPLEKEVNRNLALWTRYLLDGVTTFDRPGGTAARDQILRVAVINLKKLAGGGTADQVGIAQHAWRDREFLREQLALLKPTLIVTCGELAARLFGQVVQDDLHASVPNDRTWTWIGIPVLPANHPSLRPIQAAAAFHKLVERYERAPSGEPPLPGPPRTPISLGGAKLAKVAANNGRQAWILRPYPHGRFRLPNFLAGGFIAIGWPGIGDIGGLDQEALRSRLASSYPRQDPASWTRWLSTIVRFRDGICEGDWVVVAPALRDEKSVAIAEVTGPYAYRAELDGEAEAYPHTRAVRWIRQSTPRSKLPERVTRSMVQGTLHRTDCESLGAFLHSLGLLADARASRREAP